MKKLSDYKLIAIDFEVGPDWFFTSFYDVTTLLKDLETTPIKDIIKNYKKYNLNTIWHDDIESLRHELLETEESKNTIFLTFNGSHYDKWILKAIYHNQDVKKVNDAIFNNIKMWEYEPFKFKKNVQIIMQDCREYIKEEQNFYQTKRRGSLKDFELNMGLKIFKEDPNIFEKKYDDLTKEEKENLVDYEIHDCFATAMIYYYCEKNEQLLAGKINLLNTCELDHKLINKTTSSIVQTILGAKRKETQTETWKYKVPQFIKAHLDYKELINKLETTEFQKTTKFQYEINDGDLKILFKNGGIHTAIPNYYFKTDDKKCIVIADVTSMYPNLMANDNNKELQIWPSTLTNKDLYIKFKHEREDAKQKLEMSSYKDNDELQKLKALEKGNKLPLNGAFGITGQINGLAEEWEINRQICFAGQLSLLLLYQMLKKDGHKILQLNTDGIFFICDKNKVESITILINMWTNLTGLSMKTYTINNGLIAQKDVNHFLLWDYDNEKNSKKRGELRRTYSITPDSNNMTIINEAVLEYIVNNVRIEDTVRNCKDVIKFQISMLSKAKSYKKTVMAFKTANKKQPWKVIKEDGVDKSNRCFASLTPGLGQPVKIKDIFKLLDDGKDIKIDSYNSFNNSPINCFIWNESIYELDISKINLDYEYYINLAKSLYFSYTGKEYR